MLLAILAWMTQQRNEMRNVDTPTALEAILNLNMFDFISFFIFCNE